MKTQPLVKKKSNNASKMCKARQENSGIVVLGFLGVTTFAAILTIVLCSTRYI
jgi:hypothetical protein